MIWANSSGEASRPLVWMLSWKRASSDIGCAPMRPTAACAFCAWIAAIRSPVVSPSPVSLSVSIHTRIA